jgi:amidophosphoribosyltransferase
MSDSIKHECGIALIRLKKPLAFYQQKYGSATYGLNKLFLLMSKQQNRGQDGAGIATIKLNTSPGDRYISRHRSTSKNSVAEIFEHVQNRLIEVEAKNPIDYQNAEWLKSNAPYIGELLLGHLRYGTFGNNNIENCHPFLRQNNWITRNLIIAGNFNMTNVDELLNQLYELGQHPKEKADTITVLEKIGHFLDDDNQRLFDHYKTLGYSNIEITKLIEENIDVPSILTRSAKSWDGGYTICGMVGHGDAFVMRDPSGIRPAFYFEDEEVVVVTSERPAIQTAFNVPLESIKEIQPGHALIIKKSGLVSEHQFIEPAERKACSFERIYFSRGNDAGIYMERKQLGRMLVPKILAAIDNDLTNTVFSYIPNTAEVAFYGMVEGLHKHVRKYQKEKILNFQKDLSNESLEKLLSMAPRVEKITLKDAKLRTFITQDEDRQDMVAHIYDTTYGVVKKGVDTLVVLDDSIVRGTTLKQSILRILDRLGPKKIIIVSSAPQIRYPDCYGIDMSRMGEFVAFSATIALLKERGMDQLIQQVYENCKSQVKLPSDQIKNFVKEIYKPFSPEEISQKIAEIVRPKDIHAEVEVIFQSIEDLHMACPGHTGDWYFSGDFPTPGGMKVVNNAFINFIEGSNKRAY